MKLASHDSTSVPSISSEGGVPLSLLVSFTTATSLGRAPLVLGGAAACGARARGAGSYSSAAGFSARICSSVSSRCGIAVSRSASSGISARARERSAKSTGSATSASFHSGPRTRISPLGPEIAAPPGNDFPPSLATRFVNETKNAVFLRNVAHEALPSRDARRTGHRVLARPHAARGRRARDEDHRGAVECEQGAGERVPGVLAHEHRESSPRCIERADVVAALHEALLVEQPVGGEKVLPVDVANERLVAAQAHPHRAVVQYAVPQLVESDRDLDGPRAGLRGEICALEIGGECAGGAGLFADAALEEVAGERGLGQVEHVRRRIERLHLGKNLAQTSQIGRVLALAWGELQRGQLQNVRHSRKMRV